MVVCGVKVADAGVEMVVSVAEMVVAAG